MLVVIVTTWWVPDLRVPLPSGLVWLALLTAWWRVVRGRRAGRA